MNHVLAVSNSLPEQAARQVDGYIRGPGECVSYDRFVLPYEYKTDFRTVELTEMLMTIQANLQQNALAQLLEQIPNVEVPRVKIIRTGSEKLWIECREREGR